MKRTALLFGLGCALFLTGCRKANQAATQPPVPPAPPQATPPVTARPKKRSQPAQVPAAPVEAVSQLPPPRLGQMLSEGEQRRYNQSIDRDLQSARSALATIAGVSLTESQAGILRQVQSFIAQAQEMRKTDLIAAKGLSHKADVLAQELTASR